MRRLIDAAPHADHRPAPRRHPVFLGDGSVLAVADPAAGHPRELIQWRRRRRVGRHTLRRAAGGNGH